MQLFREKTTPAGYIVPYISCKRRHRHWPQYCFSLEYRDTLEDAQKIAARLAGSGYSVGRIKEDRSPPIVSWFFGGVVLVIVLTPVAIFGWLAGHLAKWW